jgi:hypothetical protein
VSNWNTIQRHDRCIDLKIYNSILDEFNFAEKSSIANIAKLKPSWIFANLQYRPMLGAQNPLGRGDLYRATPAVTQSLGFSGLIRSTAPFCRLLRHTRGCGGSVLTQIITGPHAFSRLIKHARGCWGPILIRAPSQVCFRRESWCVVNSCGASGADLWDRPGHGATPRDRTKVASRRRDVGAGGSSFAHCTGLLDLKRSVKRP